MRRDLGFGKALVLVGIAGLMTTGCLGPQVLEETVEHLPAPDPHVDFRLKIKPPADVLVLYTDYEPRSGKQRRRAFCVFANERRLRKGKRPRFVTPDGAGNLVPVPIFRAYPRPREPGVGMPEMYAIALSPSRFRLQSRDRTLIEFELPAYDNWLTARKVFLFPLALAADAVGGAAVAGAVGVAAAASGLAESGESYTLP